MCVSVETVFKNGVVVHSKHWNIMVTFVACLKIDSIKYTTKDCCILNRANAYIVYSN